MTPLRRGTFVDFCFIFFIAFMYQTNKGTVLCMVQVRRMLPVRDGPFDIHGGAGIFPRDKLFFLSFSITSYFFKSKPQQVFYFFEKNTLKSEKCKRKQHIE